MLTSVISLIYDILVLFIKIIHHKVNINILTFDMPFGMHFFMKEKICEICTMTFH